MATVGETGESVVRIYWRRGKVGSNMVLNKTPRNNVPTFGWVARVW